MSGRDHKEGARIKQGQRPAPMAREGRLRTRYVRLRSTKLRQGRWSIRPIPPLRRFMVHSVHSVPFFVVSLYSASYERRNLRAYDDQNGFVFKMCGTTLQGNSDRKLRQGGVIPTYLLAFSFFAFLAPFLLPSGSRASLGSGAFFSGSQRASVDFMSAYFASPARLVHSIGSLVSS